MCYKTFGRNARLANHIRIKHEGQSNNKCDSCEKSFTEPGSLSKHIKTVQVKEISIAILVGNLSLHHKI